MANVPPRVHEYATSISRSIGSFDSVPSTEIPEISDSDNEDVIVEGLVPPVHATVLQQTIGPRTAKQDGQPQYNVDRAICSLNIICYRHNGTCVMEPIMTTMESRYRTPESYQQALKQKPDLIVNDSQLFTQMRQKYRTRMCGFWRRWFGLKTLRSFRILEYNRISRPHPIPLDNLILQEILYTYKNASKINTETAWIEWVFRLRQEDKRHALEFVEGWNLSRVIIVGCLPWLISLIIGITWVAVTKDAQTAFTVASFVLTSVTGESSPQCLTFSGCTHRW
ncbi:hypothetical protein V2W45_1366780 [Cenococcum geophilum]